MRTLIALMLFATTPVAAGDSVLHRLRKDALVAFKAGDYQKAFRLYKPLAEQGYAWAQYGLGVMYHEGNGVPEDYAKAVHWYTKGAKQGNARAQNALGSQYDFGEGVPQNYAGAYALFSITAAQGYKEGEKEKNSAAKLMTPAQITQGKKFANKFWKKYVVPFQ